MKQLVLDPAVPAKSIYTGNFRWAIVEKATVGAVIRFDGAPFAVFSMAAYPRTFKELTIDSGTATLLCGEDGEAFPGGSGGTLAGSTGGSAVEGTQADASATKPNPILVGGWDGANLRALLTSTLGELLVIAGKDNAGAKRMLPISGLGALAPNDSLIVGGLLPGTGTASHLILDAKRFLVAGAELATLDSTTAVLGGGGTYTTLVAQDSMPYAALCAVVFANQAGNAFIDQSADGVNWDINDTVAVVASVGNRIRAARVAPFCRLRYVNGGVAQGSFRFYLFGTTPA
jgi:hypothetical protein